VIPYQFPTVVARNEYGAALEMRKVTAEHKEMSSHGKIEHEGGRPMVRESEPA
jgi:hypothetical protein